MQDKFFHVSWDKIHQDAKVLSAKLKGRQEWQGLVAVTRGGLVPASILAQELDLRWVDTICIASYSQDKEAADMNVMKSIQGNGKGLIVIDDLVDSGRTFHWIQKRLPEAYFTAVYAKPEGCHTLSQPDDAVTIDQDQWIVFPWEDQLQQAV
ncbi:MAG: xanthine phosphoribosyltransferase [Janthinobacterium lividum]